MLGSWSDRPRTVNDVSAVFSYVGISLCGAGAIFGDVGGWLLVALRNCDLQLSYVVADCVD